MSLDSLIHFAYPTLKGIVFKTIEIDNYISSHFSNLAHSSSKSIYLQTIQIEINIGWYFSTLSNIYLSSFERYYIQNDIDRLLIILFHKSFKDL